MIPCIKLSLGLYHLPNEILPGLLPFVVVFNHGQLFGHGDGEAVFLSRGAIVRIDDSCKISTLYKTILFDSTGDPVTELCFHFQKLMQLPGIHCLGFRVNGGMYRGSREQQCIKSKGPAIRRHYNVGTKPTIHSKVKQTQN
jgi:hypothetical protein